MQNNHNRRRSSVFPARHSQLCVCIFNTGKLNNRLLGKTEVENAICLICQNQRTEINCFRMGEMTHFPSICLGRLIFPHGTSAAISTFLPHRLQRVLNVAALTFIFLPFFFQRHVCVKGLVVNVPRVGSTLQDERACCRLRINGSLRRHLQQLL